jgi:hypothetical protein
VVRARCCAEQDILPKTKEKAAAATCARDVAFQQLLHAVQ